MPVQSWISESTDEEWIPQHRIRYFKKICVDGQIEIVWDRETRVDKIFNSLAQVGGRREEMDVLSEDGGVNVG